jgi:hypothetical protein
MASFSDDFNRADSSNLGAGWVEVSGDWSIISNQLSTGTTGGTILLRAATAMATNDHYAQVTIAATTSASQGVWCRGDAALTTGYAVRNNGTNWALFSVTASTFTSIGTYAAAAVAGDVVKIQAVGSTITAYINGVSRISVTNTAVSSGTTVGIRSDVNTTLRYDNFTAADVATGATLGIASSSETAQSLSGSAAATLGTAASTETAQPLTGAKTAALAASAATETAQALAGTKTGPLGAAGAVETAQPLAGSKTAVLGTAIEVAAAQILAGAKPATLTVAAQVEAAQPLTGAKSLGLSPAGAAETAQPLTGTKTVTLAPAIETSTSRPLTPAGGTIMDVTLTVGTPFSPWTAGTAPRRWTAVEAPGPWTAKEVAP